MTRAPAYLAERVSAEVPMINCVIEKLPGLVDEAAHRSGRVIFCDEPAAKVFRIALSDRGDRLEFEELDTPELGLFKVGSRPFLQIRLIHAAVAGGRVTAAFRVHSICAT